MSEKLKILVCPLDWGLGHATRCIPIIRKLLEKDFEVLIAASGRPAKLLQSEFPLLKVFDFPGYNINYNRYGYMVLSMLLQSVKIIKGIINEKKLIKELVAQEKIDAVLSDNRFGLSGSGVYSIIMTHQVKVKMPRFYKILEPLLYKFNLYYINKYDACWVPDFKEKDTLSGELSHFKNIPSHIQYIGPLSRFRKKDQQIKPELQVLAIISGPEPQRTVFENKIKEQLLPLNITGNIVCGKTESRKIYQLNNSINVLSHIDQSRLEELFAKSEVIICRSGYSSIMDIVNMGKKAIFIPTPGQTEQEYLAQYFYDNGNYYYMRQSQMNIEEALLELDDFTPLKTHDSGFMLDAAIDNLLQTLKKK